MTRGSSLPHNLDACRLLALVIVYFGVNMVLKRYVVLTEVPLPPAASLCLSVVRPAQAASRRQTESCPGN